MRVFYPRRLRFSTLAAPLFCPYPCPRRTIGHHSPEPENVAVDIPQLLEKYGPLTVAFVLLAWAFRLMVVKFIPWLMEAKQKEAEANAKNIYDRIDSLIEAFKQGVLGVDAKIDNVSEKIDGVSEKLDEHHGKVMERFNSLAPDKKKDG